MIKTQKTDAEAFAALPAHLQKTVAKHEAKMKEFGIVDLSKLDRSKFDDFHPIHAML